jgi:16S rRNA (adenine1518-N6/adenine1519-N6)-dimethyltransferase
VGRRLGQHFLADNSILDRIVDAIAPAATDVVIEVGPGQGTLTRRLAPRVGRVVAIEADRGFVGGEWPVNVSVVHGDALEEDWGSLAAVPAFKVIGNIPYYITTPLIEKALTAARSSVIVFLVQKEVADRLAAAPGGKIYGALSVGVQSAASVERLFIVKAGAFRPPPKVDSAVVRLTPLASPLVSPKEHAAFRTFTVGLFGQRRKQLARSLRDIASLDPAGVLTAVGAAGLKPTDRVEVASPAQLVALYRAVSR